MIGSLRPCAMNARRLAARERRLPALDRGHEAGEGEDPRRCRPVRPEAERVAHHRAHREAAEDGGPGATPVRSQCSSWKSASRAVGGVERDGIRVADARHDVPVMARPAGERQRPARGHDVQAALGIEHVGETEQIVLVGAAAVVQDQQPLGLAGRGRSRNSSALTRTS